MKKNYLVLSALDKNIPKKFKIFLIGEWCKYYKDENPFKNSSCIVPKYHWDIPKKLSKDHNYLKNLHLKITEKLHKSLNLYHRENHELKYWRIQIDPFLYNYISVIFDRWENLRQLFKKKNKFFTKKSKNNYSNTGIKDWEDFRDKSIQEEWNHELLLKIIEFNFKKKCFFLKNNLTIKKPFERTKNPIVPNFSRFQSLIYDFYNFFYKKTPLIFYFNSFSYKRIAQFNIFLKFPNLFFDTLFNSKIHTMYSNLIFSKKSLKERDKFFKYFRFKTKNKFEEFLIKSLQKDLPICLLEDYKKISKLSNKIQLFPRVILTHFGAWMNPVGKNWIASLSEKGTRLLIASHGGSLPRPEMIFSFLDKVSYKSLTWHKPLNRYQIQLPSEIKNKFKNFNIQVNSDSSNKKIVIVLNSDRRQAWHLSSLPQSSQILESFNQVLNFYNKVKKNIKEETLIKTYPAHDHWGERKFFAEKVSKHQVVSNRNIYDVLKEAKIILCNNSETVFSQCMASNIPTVLLLNKKHYKFHKNFEKLINKLKKAKIIFYDEFIAAKHINNIWSEPGNWWKKKLVQDARIMFLKSCLDYDKDWFDSWKNYLKNV